MLCVLCGEELQDFGNYQEGNNPSPLAYIGRCCDECDLEKVLPARCNLLGEAGEQLARDYQEAINRREVIVTLAAYDLGKGQGGAQ
jgi:hypothetical protein